MYGTVSFHPASSAPPPSPSEIRSLFTINLFSDSENTYATPCRQSQLTEHAIRGRLLCLVSVDGDYAFVIPF